MGAMGAAPACLVGVPDTRTETSTIVSLRELRSIEQQRIDEERASRQRDRQVREDLAREVGRRAEAEAIAAREAERAEIARREAAEAAIVREQQVAIEIAAAQTRVRVQAELDAARLAAEIELRRAHVQRTRPVGLIAVLVTLVLGAGGLAVYIDHQRGQLADAHSQLDATSAAAAAARAQAAAAENARHELKLQIDAMHAMVDKLNADAVAKQQQHEQVPWASVSAPRPQVARPVAPQPQHPGPIVVPEECKHSAICR